MTRRGHEEKLLGTAIGGECPHDRKNAIRNWHASSPSRFGALDVHTLGSGAADKKDGKRHFHEVTHPDLAQLRPPQPGPSGDQEQVRQPSVPECCPLVERLQLSLSEGTHLGRYLAALGNARGRHGIGGDHPLSHCPGEEHAIRQGISDALGGTPEAPDGFRAHVSVAYSNADADAATIRRALDEAEPPNPGPATYRTVSLIRMHRDRRMYEWETVDVVDLRG